MGRVKGSKSTTIIKDPSLEPYFLFKDKYCYTVMDHSVTENKGGNKEGFTQSYGYYSTLPHALKKIASLKIDEPQKEYTSIKEYINEYRKLKLEIDKMLSKLELE